MRLFLEPIEEETEIKMLWMSTGSYFSIAPPLPLVIDTCASPNLKNQTKKQNNNILAITLPNGKDAIIFWKL